GTSKQEIFSDSAQSVTGKFVDIPSKRTAYIIFPDTVEIANENSVVLNARTAADAQYVRLTRGYFVLDSDTADIKRDYAGENPAQGLANSIRASHSTLLAHLKIGKNVVYSNAFNNPADMLPADYQKVGRFQVNFKSPVGEKASGYTAATPYRRIYGMGSPYDYIKADYFMFNTLIMPTPVGFLGNLNRTVTDPTTTLRAGTGFVIGIDLRGGNPTDYTDFIKPEYDGLIDFTKRTTSVYKFNRLQYDFENNPNNIYRYATPANRNVYKDERLVDHDVKVELTKGYNYLSNPFMAPLSVEKLATTLNASPVSEWGNIMPGNETTAGVRDIINRIWVLTPNTMAFEMNSKVFYSHTYYTIKPMGGTYTGELYTDPDKGLVTNADGDFLIAPLQLFRVYYYKDVPVEITIPKSEVKHGTTRFIRSNATERYDDFVFEVLDETTLTSDRVCVVLRNPEELLSLRSSAEIDRLSFKTNSVEIAAGTQLLKRSESLPAQSSMSLLYLKNDNGDALDEKTISTATAYENLYMTPSLTPQNVYIRGLRLNTRLNIQEIWLVDKKFGTKTLISEPNSYYKTTTEPTDAEDRFQLVFSTQLTGTPDEIQVTQPLTAHYSGGMLTVKTFDETDFGSYIYIYDMQGRIVSRFTVNNPVMQNALPLPAGIYVVKVVGKKTLITKITVK
ncbi:MAG: T9SS type A sorting domain-containing protein, partial [Bacteroidales bacterium]|nr:T9SS type A sorting domain-containing protein [Bacteroidales bacterium]